MLKEKSQVLYDFWSSFGIPAYDVNSVPDDAGFPRITYSTATDNLDHVLLRDASIWFRETTWKNISDLTEVIAEAIDNTNPIPCKGGYMWIYRGHPFAQRMSDDADSMIKRMYLNVSIEFLTAH